MAPKTKKLYIRLVLAAGLFSLLFAAACGSEDSPKPAKPFTVSKGSITGVGIIGINPEGLVKAGTKITLTAEPGNGYTFGAWNISPSVNLETGSSGVWTFKMPSNDLTVGAEFTLADGFSLIQQGNIDGEGTYEISPEGPFEEGDEVTITALPGENYAFVSWDISPEVNPVELYPGIWTFQMPGETVTVNAVFARTYSVIHTEIIFGGQEDDEITVSEEKILPGTQVPLSIAISGRPAVFRWSFSPASVLESLRTATAPNSWYFDMPASDLSIFVEVLASDTDIALGRGEFALASDANPSEPGSAAASAFDGEKYAGTGGNSGADAKSHWQADGSEDPRHWIGVDLGNAYYINYVWIYWHPGDSNAWDGMTSFEVQVAGEIYTMSKYEDSEYVYNPEPPNTFAAGNYEDEGWTVAAVYKYEPRSGAGTDGPTTDLDGIETFDNTSKWNIQIPLEPGTEARWIRIKMIEPLAEWNATANPANAAWTLGPRVSGFEAYRQLPE